MQDISNIYIVLAAKCIAAGLCISLAGVGVSLAQGFVGAKACESIANRPEAAKLIQQVSTFALCMIESTNAIALVVVLLIFFSVGK